METGLFQLGPIIIYRFGFSLGLAYLAGGLVGRRQALRYGISRNGWWWLMFGLMVATLVGARVVDILPDIGYYAAHPEEIWRLPVEGLSFYGGLLACCAVLAFAAPRLNQSFWQLADLLTLPFLAGAVTAAVIWGAPVVRLPSYVTVLFDIAYLTGMFALMWWTWLKMDEQVFPGEIALFALAADGVLRLLLVLLEIPYLGADWASLVPIAGARLFVTLIAGAALVFRGSVSRWFTPLGDPFRRPLSRWFGWLILYGFLVAIALTIRA